MLVGGSSGAAMHAALLASKRLKKGQRCVVVLPDSIRNYMSKVSRDRLPTLYSSQVKGHWPCVTRSAPPLFSLSAPVSRRPLHGAARL